MCILLSATKIGLIKQSIDIILPCYNPLPGWEKVVISNFLKFKNLHPSYSVGLTIINDGSKINVTDSQKQEILSSIPITKWINLAQNGGKGAALRAGIIANTADFNIFTDIDFPYTDESLLNVCKQLTMEKRGYHNRFPSFKLLRENASNT